MSWVRLDDGFMEHTKILKLAPRDVVVHLRALCYAARRRDPHIPPEALTILATNRACADRLANVGVWDVNGDGWVIHDWDEFQGPMSGSERAREFRRRKKEVTDE